MKCTVVWLNKTYSNHIGIIQIGFTASEEREIVNIEDDKKLRRGSLFVPPQPITEVNHIEHYVYIYDTVPNPTQIPVPFSRALRCMSYGTIGTAPKMMSQEL
jgi:hypothetical protein